MYRNKTEFKNFIIHIFKLINGLDQYIRASWILEMNDMINFFHESSMKHNEWVKELPSFLKDNVQLDDIEEMKESPMNYLVDHADVDMVIE